MAAGIWIYNPDGSLAYDVGNRLFRKLGELAYNSSNGSAGFTRQPEDQAVVPVAVGWYAPVFTVNLGNNTISWDHSAIAAQRRRGGVVELWAY